MNWFRPVSNSLLGGFLIMVLAGCGSHVAYYDVKGTQDTLCIIQGTSTICEAGRSAYTMTLGFEEADELYFFYWDNATWDATLEEDGSYRAIRYYEIQDTGEACHTVQSEILRLEFTEKNGIQKVSGTWERQSETDGPATCGEMPAGSKDAITLEGVRAASL